MTNTQPFKTINMVYFRLINIVRTLGVNGNFLNKQNLHSCFS
jgi:hypothetical protein